MNGRTIKVSLSDTGKKQRNSTNSEGRVSIFDRMG
uniref:Uncharacterized protein n=2 Tax=Theileria parva TaxID=5875 RepID=Q4N230_THEPA|eukprot:XP_764178.1 hypothetical protein [Theileria parva strain Muguga]